ncbi:PHP domain-containing protein [Reinekea thalattae]|uniref:PHP domain-containing protein n=1 Tax=Reinekea thalattae TaxID=2593301 RepID=A0A5C8Z5C5_9GAMM|nr:PHP domain-containing protein [Reinekea thalattae]TXR52120.1 PHP domain-containing protein [Reinekea thalattae]
MIPNCAHEWELHCHSRFSDGSLSLPELFQLAQQNGVQHLALTDHDTCAGYRHAVDNQLVPEDLTLYPAAELSCIWAKRTLHIVGLGIDAYSEQWLAIEKDYDRRREKRFQRIVYLLQKNGLSVDEAAIRKLAEPGPPARPHIAQYLVDSGQAKNIAAVFKRWLGQGQLGDVKSHWPDLIDAVAAIQQCGGIAVIAHPHRYKLTWTKARELIADFSAAGGRGIEVACIGIHPDMSKFLVAQAQEHDLLVSGGSDFHHLHTQWLKLGTYPMWPNHVTSVKEWLLQRDVALAR